MMGQILKLVPAAEVPDSQVLADAQAAGITDAVVMGWDKNGHMYLAHSSKDLGDVLWLLEQARDAILALGREE